MRQSILKNLSATERQLVDLLADADGDTQIQVGANLCRAGQWALVFSSISSPHVRAEIMNLLKKEKENG